MDVVKHAVEDGGAAASSRRARGRGARFALVAPPTVGRSFRRNRRGGRRVVRGAARAPHADGAHGRSGHDVAGRAPLLERRLEEIPVWALSQVLGWPVSRKPRGWR
jgi:hypothetical protein